MPPRLPDRYQLNIRLGRDGDIEEWLATDEQLDRPVLIRFLPPTADPSRVEAFLGPVRAAAATTHPHLQKVYAADADPSGAYAISEWDGAVSIADRLAAGDTLPVVEFLPNAAGLADGLAAFHAAGGVHGAIDESTVHFSAAHPAKLGGFGRAAAAGTAAEDTAALARVLRRAVTGDADPGILPSHVVEGLPRALDAALERAERGEIDAAELAAALRGIPYVPADEPRERLGTVRWAIVFGLVALGMIITAAAGLAIGNRTAPSPVVSLPAVATSTTLPPPALAPLPSEVTGTVLPATPLVYDPLGDGTESDELVDNLVDGDPRTAWRTEAYSRPLADVKAGVGIVFRVTGSPRMLQVTGTAGTVYRLGWSTQPPDDPSAWDDVATGRLLPATTTIGLPARHGGTWLLWLVDLPSDPDGRYLAEIAETRFLG